MYQYPEKKNIKLTKIKFILEINFSYHFQSKFDIYFTFTFGIGNKQLFLMSVL